MGVLLFFIDGVGIGKHDPATNPLARYPSPFFPGFTDTAINDLPFDGILVPTDVTMGVAGLPQSATGQTALLTGKNAARVLGRHHPGFPTFSLRKLLLKESIFLKLEQLGKTGTFINSFTPAYFKRSDRHISASTWSLKASGFPFRWLKPDLLEGRGVSHDLTNEFMIKLGYDAPLRKVEEAAKIIAEVAQTVDFCLFEYFLTDAIGHGQDFEWAEKELDKLNTCLQIILSELPLDQHIVIVTSDHGNFEDLSTPLHTRNKVPASIWGKDAKSMVPYASRIEDITNGIVKHLY